MSGNSKLTGLVSAVLPRPAYNHAMAQPSMPPTRVKPRGVALLTLLIGGSALLVAACGGSPSGDASVAHLRTTTTTRAGDAPNNSTQSGNGSGPGAGPQGQQFAMAGGNQSQMLAFSHCMQTHGVPDFPEPNSQGVVQGSGINPGSPSFQAANKDCRHLLPNGGQPTAAQQAQAMAQALKFSQCMRAHGIPDFPDPQSGPGGGIAIRIHSSPGSDLNPQSPRFQAAQQACQGLIGKPFGGGGKASTHGSQG
jgi:hypothetical protein